MNAKTGIDCPHAPDRQRQGGCRCLDGKALVAQSHLDRLRRAAETARLVLLSSTEYTLSRSSYRFRYRQGHEWQASGQRIFRGAWRPVCANAYKRLSIDDMRQLARQRGGQCLSEHYQNNVTKLH